MKKFECNGFTATVTNKVVRWEISISNLKCAFNNSPENYSEDGEHFIKVKKGKLKEFAEYVAEQLIISENADTGSSFLEEAIDQAFEQVFESDEEFAYYPESDEEE